MKKKFVHLEKDGLQSLVLFCTQVTECEANQHDQELVVVLLQYGRPEGLGLDGSIHAQCSNNSGIYSYTYSSYIIHKIYANFAQ